MTVQLTQDLDYVSDVRSSATQVINASNMGVISQAEWNSTFGGAGRVDAACFTDSPDTGNGGLNKANISDALAVLTALNTWLDEAGMDRRKNLMTVIKV